MKCLCVLYKFVSRSGLKLVVFERKENIYVRRMRGKKTHHLLCFFLATTEQTRYSSSRTPDQSGKEKKIQTMSLLWVLYLCGQLAWVSVLWEDGSVHLFVLLVAFWTALSQFLSSICCNGVFLLNCRKSKGLHFALWSLHKANVLMSRGSIAEVVVFKILGLGSINIVLTAASYRVQLCVWWIVDEVAILKEASL